MRRIAELFHRDDGTWTGVFAVLFAALAGFITLQNAPPAEAVFPFDITTVPRAHAGHPFIALDAHIPPVAAIVSDGTTLARSIDHGRTFSGAHTTDEHASLAFDARGNVYAVHDSARPRVVVSSDAGRTWSPERVLAATGSFGRAWLTAREDGQIVVTAVDNEAHRLRSWISGNHARTFVGPFTVPATVTLAGPLLVGPYQSLHQAFIGTARDGSPFVGYAASADGGRTWSAQRVAALSASGARDSLADPDARRPFVGVDDLGALYVSWVTTESSAPEVILAVSTDHGATWPTVRVLASDGPSTAPVIVAGGFGKVNIAFLRGQAHKKAWDLVLLHSADAATIAPTFRSNVVAKRVSGGFAMVSDIDGTALLAYGEGSGLKLARQAAGTRLH